ncbi:MAG: U32 family peptidase [Firmicutes bacterium]|nr:U32 family peptidase [Bacillota bacterium]
MKKIELLAPSGSKESLIGAINAGANAIYLAGKRFGARAYAANFEEKDMISLIRYAHLRGVFVYVAINTLIFNDEIKDLLEYTDFLVNQDVDAFIVADLGMISLLAKRYPNVEIHASTQVNTHNIHQVKFLKELGVKRIVMARETPLDVIKQIKKNVDIEIEVFVHGALCVCYSGNCLMSSMIGGRSGNRGECAQPCRLPYKLYKGPQLVADESYLLSTKDLMTLEYVDALIDAGVDSFKIEGRMRKPEYVTQAVLSYKKAIQAYQERKVIQLENEILKLKKVFNREYTKGYILDEKPNEINNDYRPNHLGVELGTVIDYKDNKAIIKLVESLEINDGYRIIGNKDYGNTVSRILKNDSIVKKAFPNDVIKIDVTEKIEVGSKVLKTLDSNLESSLAIYLDENYKTISLKGEVSAYIGEYLIIDVTDSNYHVSFSSKDVLEKASTKSVTKEQIIDQISKLGNTPFYFSELIVRTDDQSFIPIKVLNELRRQAIDEIKALRELDRRKHEIIEINEKKIENKPFHFELIAKVTTKEQFDQVNQMGIQTIYFEDTINMKVNQEGVFKVRKRILQHGFDIINEPSVIHETGSLLQNPKQFPLISDEFFNVTNIYTANLLFKNHVNRVTLSPELSKERVFGFRELFMNKFNYVPNLELVVYGRVDLMISKYCPIAKTFKTKQNCHLCELNQYYLEDRMKSKFPLINDGNCNIRILNHKPLNLIEYINQIKLSGIEKIRLDFTTERIEEVREVIKNFNKAMMGESIHPNSKIMTYGRFIH